ICDATTVSTRAAWKRRKSGIWKGSAAVMRSDTMQPASGKRRRCSEPPSHVTPAKGRIAHMSANHDPRFGAPVDAIAPRLETRFRIRGAVPWGHSIPYVQVDSEVGPLVVAALPLDCEADPELERWFLTLAFGLAGIPGRAFPRIVRYGVAD